MKIANFNLNERVLIVAELSANHNGSLEVAKNTIKAAKKAGADAIKLQTYTPDSLTLNSKKPDFIVSGGTLWDGRSFYELYKEAQTPWQWHKELFEIAANEGLICFSTPFCKDSVDLLESLESPCYKIASFEANYYELVRYAASKKKPMLISIGIASFDEIEEVVRICKAHGSGEVVLLQCTSAYPAPKEDANLKTISNLAQNFGVAPGFSDHTLSNTASIMAVSLGAKVIEKHFILDRSIGGADADFSLDFDEFKSFVKSVREAELLLGKVSYEMSEKKLKSRKFSRSLYVSKDIKKGETLTYENIRCVRPNGGLEPKYMDEILGKKASCDLEFGTALRFEYIL